MRPVRFLPLLLLLFTTLCWLTGCSFSPVRRETGAAEKDRPLRKAPFESVAARAGIHFVLHNGATGKDRFVEFAPAGCAFLDYDNDGYQDILLLQAGSSDPPRPGENRPHCALYHNNGNGTFTDVTAISGLDKGPGYALGVAVGDYDNDGYEDLFLTGFHGNFLFHNELGRRKGKGPLFRDVTAQMGLSRIHSTGFATAAAFGDYDNDGRLDLYVCYYSDWTWGKDGGYYTNTLHKPETHVLFHNAGNRFVDVSHMAGIDRVRGRGLAVAFLDADGDGRQDIFVANDQTPNMLWHNEGNGTFTNSALRSGCAYGLGGQMMAGMCAALADYDHSGRESLYVSNRQSSPKTLFRNQGDGLLMPVEAGVTSFDTFSFGGEFMDYDADGWADLLVVNGMINDTHLQQTPGVKPAQRKQLFHNEGDGRFREVGDPAHPGILDTPTIARGLAVGDYDNDGRWDALINNQNSAAELLHNTDTSKNHWIGFKTVGVRSNRDGLHTRFVLEAGKMRQTATVRAGSSYLSVSDRRVYFGLGAVPEVARVTVRWPSGACDVLTHLKADAYYVVTEGRGVTGRLPRQTGLRAAIPHRQAREGRP